MGQVFALAMQKGGVGKTTTTLSLGTLLAERGRRVLLIDLDPQANLTQGLGVDPTTLEYGVYEVLLNPERGADFAVMATEHGVDLIAAALDLAGAELELAGKVGRELLLRKALRQTRERYDYILIDPPPSLGIFSLNALAAADAVLVPMQLHAYALQAMPQLEQTIALVREIHPTLKLGGIVCTLADRRTNLSGQIEAQVRERYGELVFDTVIPVNIKLAEAPTSGTPIGTYAAQSAGATAYAALAAELEARYAQ
ncbi:ParA family protein [Candidatus Viridilinea mediisalina]|uniref:Sporulation initiation inhibitor Soj n=1 Tax=Candidatus Viridilinea mediisalina TaxID=2024553 RepID=A0A2A6RH18_9CHLR|nr:ParA family protein [Candidatus Viridilinea mediisalina]PDW02179.1 sporulation initiation inhibitor Soj [Candidatus Viridilinea mediisalina]